MDDARGVVQGDLVICDGIIESVGSANAPSEGAVVEHVDGAFVLPGFIQGHTHLGQSLFRGLAERRDLLPWLRERVWPLEAAHDPDSAYWSGMHGGLDCLLGGTTTIQDIGLVHHTDRLADAIGDLGLRAVLGPCLMDTGEGVPPRLLQDPDTALAQAEQMIRGWDSTPRIQGSICPRFILSCSEASWRGAVELANQLQIPVHTHLLEHPGEDEEVRQVLGRGQVEILDGWGVLDTDLRVAHGVWFQDEHAEILAGRSLSIVHCPSANLKLGSGVADIQRLARYPGVRLGIACDGAPCNNDMDALEEMRLAALLQGIKVGPAQADARLVLELATREGARALGMESQIGSLEPGKRADLVVMDLNAVENLAGPGVSVYDRIVYTARRTAVRDVYVDGRKLVEAGAPTGHRTADVLVQAERALGQLTERAGIAG